jgi:hypothetical protein
MMTHTIKNIIESRDTHINKHITKTEYTQWNAGFLFDGLRNLRYGQSFCNKFNIKDNILYYYYASASLDADKYIRANYVK